MSENDGAICNAGGDPGAAETVQSTSPDSPSVSAPPTAPETESATPPAPAPATAPVATQSDGCPVSPVEIANAVQQSAVNDTTAPQGGPITNGDEVTTISRLEQEVQKRTHERDNYQKKLEATEKKLAALQASYDTLIAGGGDEMTLRREMEDLKNTLTQTQLKLDDRGRLVANQENQINALGKQVSSLKEVVSITKSLLEIRNMEVKHLQNDVDSMENKITEERERQSKMLGKMEAAVRLNADLKQEYETQLRLFQDLRGKYEQKVTLLTEENRALENATAQSVAQ